MEFMYFYNTYWTGNEFCKLNNYANSIFTEAALYNTTQEDTWKCTILWSVTEKLAFLFLKVYSNTMVDTNLKIIQWIFLSHFFMIFIFKSNVNYI